MNRPDMRAAVRGAFAINPSIPSVGSLISQLGGARAEDVTRSVCDLIADGEIAIGERGELRRRKSA